MYNVSIKYIREQLKNVHKITESEYEELFKNKEDDISKLAKKVVSPHRPAPTPMTPDYLAPYTNLSK